MLVNTLYDIGDELIFINASSLKTIKGTVYRIEVSALEIVSNTKQVRKLEVKYYLTFKKEGKNESITRLEDQLARTKEELMQKL